MTDKKILKPGDFICGAEENAGGQGTFNSNDEIYSSVFGTFENEGHEAKVKTNKTIKSAKIGDEVYGIVIDVMDSKALVAVVPLSNEKGVRFTPEGTAVIRVQDISERYVQTIKEEFRIGDIIKARVIAVGNGLDLSTKGSDEYGVIKAFCSRCRNVLVLKGSQLNCKRCERGERRKTSKYYLENGE